MPYQFIREPLTTDHQERLTQACRSTDEKLIIWTLLETGLRVSEVADITRDSVDFQTHRITIMGKGRATPDREVRTKRRVLKLSPMLVALLEPYLVAHDTLGMGVRKIQRIVERVAKRSKLTRPVSPHVLRHTFAVRALQKGMNIKALSLWLGHTSLQTTEIYLNLSPDHVIKEFEDKW